VGEVNADEGRQLSQLEPPARRRERRLDVRLQSVRCNVFFAVYGVQQVVPDEAELLQFYDEFHHIPVAELDARLGLLRRLQLREQVPQVAAEGVHCSRRRRRGDRGGLRAGARGGVGQRTAARARAAHAGRPASGAPAIDARVPLED
jgi:hypothetical protein